MVHKVVLLFRSEIGLGSIAQHRRLNVVKLNGDGTAKEA
jgi:hypothetical protein